jgi:hypothetical protein
VPLRRAIWVGACVVASSALVAAWLLIIQPRNTWHGNWNGDAIRATFVRVVPAHNDASFLYVLENRTNSDYRIADESEVKILGRSRSTGGLMPKVGEHVSGEFPLVVPARRKVHFALVWTADRDIDPARMDDFFRNLNVSSFVVLDRVRRYQIEFQTGR